MMSVPAVKDDVPRTADDERRLRERLQASALFGRLDGEVLSEVMAAMRKECFPRGSYVFAEVRGSTVLRT